MELLASFQFELKVPTFGAMSAISGAQNNKHYSGQYGANVVPELMLMVSLTDGIWSSNLE